MFSVSVAVAVAEGRIPVIVMTMFHNKFFYVFLYYDIFLLCQAKRDVFPHHQRIGRKSMRDNPVPQRSASFAKDLNE